MKRIKTILSGALVWALLFGFGFSITTDSTAQDKKEKRVTLRSKKAKGDKKMMSDDVLVIEVKDGTLWVDGKEITDIENADRPIWVKRDGDANAWVSGNSDERRGFAFFNGEDDSEGYAISTSPRNFVFKSDGGNFTVFDDEDFEFEGGEFEFDGDRKFNVFFKEEAERAVGRARRMNEETAERMHSSMKPLLERYALRSVDGEGPVSLYMSHSSDDFDAKTMKLEMQSKQLAMKIRRSDTDTSEMEDELDTLLDKIFEVKQEGRQKKIDKLRKQLEKLEQQKSTRSSERAEIIEARMNELLGKSNKHNW